MSITQVPLPRRSVLKESETKYDYVDGYTTALPRRGITPVEVGRAFFSSGPKWINVLFGLRNKIVALLGLKTPGGNIDRQAAMDAFTGEPGERMGLFQVFAKTDNELVLGEDDKHLDFRVSLFISDKSEIPLLTISTTVVFHNRFGRLYFLPVRPFHRLLVPAMLKGIVRMLKKQAAANLTTKGTK